MRSVMLFGSGSPIIVDVEESCARRGWRIVAVVKNVEGPDYPAGGAPVLRAAPGMLAGHGVVLPLFTPANRESAWRHAVTLGAEEFPPLTDPTSVLPRSIEIGEGAYVNAGCTVGAAVRIGRFAFVNRSASLGHHLELGEFASVGPGAVIAGQVGIGRAAMIGAGAVILPGVSIGEGAIVPAGTVVRRDIAAKIPR